MIPVPEPGKKLLLTGLDSVDSKFTQGESLLDEITRVKRQLDSEMTDFVRVLGAETHWEMSPKFSRLVKMMLVVMAASVNGDLTSIDLGYVDSSPYLVVNVDLLNKRTRRVYKQFRRLIEAAADVEKQLEPYEGVVNNLSETVKYFTRDIGDKLEEANYNVRDAITAIQRTDANVKKITDLPRTLVSLKEGVNEARQEIVRVVGSLKSTIEEREKIVTRGVQAYSEGLTSASSIVLRFWPINDIEM
jgi:methyl-accepting chemotaxis protein